ncbi:hypothetical protein QTP88_002883 [Uroleucon formosanum]
MECHAETRRRRRRIPATYTDAESEIERVGDHRVFARTLQLRFIGLSSGGCKEESTTCANDRETTHPHHTTTTTTTTGDPSQKVLRNKVRRRNSPVTSSKTPVVWLFVSDPHIKIFIIS